MYNLNTTLKLTEPLTPQELRVAHLIAQGNTTPEIATIMKLSPRTVEVHRANIMKKMGIHAVNPLRTALIGNNRQGA